MNSLHPYNSVKYFPGLNSLRFFAAFLVVISHAESIRKKSGFDNLEGYGLFQNGGNAVSFFFVLSGFLITYLLLKEYGETGTVNVKYFYLNRVLRIWPLYFLLVGFGAILLPKLASLINYSYTVPYHFDQVWYYFIFFLPGLVTFYYGHHFLEPLWSIGVEEVFYLFWAPLFKRARKNILSVLVAIVVVKLVLITLGQVYKWDGVFRYLLSIFQFEAMAVGGLGAYFVFHRKSSLESLWLYRRGVQTIFYLLLTSYLVFHPAISAFLQPFSTVTTPVVTLLVDFLFIYLIIGTSLVPANLFRLENRKLSYLGEISYGIYMYQLVAISIAIILLKGFLANLNLILGTMVYYAVILCTLIAISSLSKRFFENFFLKYKKKTHT
jgi:peptidoglycan/LPS O-acetylase OafA/YrhL